MQIAQAQSLQSHQNLNINFLGEASLVSLNYEYGHQLAEKVWLFSEVGLGYNREFLGCVLQDGCTPKNFLTVPHHLTVNLGRGRNFFEGGMGGTLVVGSQSKPYWAYPIVGYRFQPEQARRMTFRIYAALPISGKVAPDLLFLPVGINLGLRL